jgi:hypothetical protein
MYELRLDRTSIHVLQLVAVNVGLAPPEAVLDKAAQASVGTLSVHAATKRHRR